MNPLDVLVRNRKILYPGRGDIPNFRNGTKVTFHFRTVALFDHKHEDHKDDHSKCTHVSANDNLRERVIDDSKHSNDKKPMELFIGKQFKFPLWEEWLKQMRIGELSEIKLDWHYCSDVYPLLSKSYRNFARPKSAVDYETDESRMNRTSNHCCGMQSKRSYGYKDLDELVEHPPSTLQFTIELLTVVDEEQTEKEVWLMSEDEMNRNVPELRQEGNRLFIAKQYDEAAAKYCKALAILEQLMMREKPNDDDWNRFDRMKIPLLSNLSQCELFLGKPYQALEHSDEVVQKDAQNVKAFFRRGKANLAVWNVEEARKDFAKVIELDSTLTALVNEQLAELERLVKQEDSKNRELLKGKLFS